MPQQIAALGHLMRDGGYEPDAVAEIDRQLAPGRAGSGRRSWAAYEAFRRAVADRFGRQVPPALAVDALDLDLLERLRRHFLAPDKLTIVVTGRFDPERAEAAIRAAFESWDPPPAPSPLPPSEPSSAAVASRIAVIDEDAAQLFIDLAYPVPGGCGDRLGAARVVEASLGERAGRLRSQLGASYEMRTMLSMNGFAGPPIGSDCYFHVAGDVDPARADEALTALRTSIAELGRGLDGGELARSRTVAARAIAGRILDPDLLSDRILEVATRDVPPGHALAALTAVQRLGAADLAPILAAFAPAQEVLRIRGPRAAVAAAFAAFGTTPELTIE
jgi:hypothetical protein